MPCETMEGKNMPPILEWENQKQINQNAFEILLCTRASVGNSTSFTKKKIQVSTLGPSYH